MSKKSKKSSGKAAGKPAIDRPFDPAIEARAKEITTHYSFLIRPHEELGYMGRGVEMPFVFADGKTPQECLDSIREALWVGVAAMLEQGEVPPVPVDDRRRQEQINIRVSTEEKMLLEHAARNGGFRSVSDYVRSASLTSVR